MKKKEQKKNCSTSLQNRACNSCHLLLTKYHQIRKDVDQTFLPPIKPEIFNRNLYEELFMSTMIVIVKGNSENYAMDISKTVNWAWKK